MLADRVSNPGPLSYESGALPIALRSPAVRVKLKFLLKEFQFEKSLKIWWNMADIVCHAPANYQ